MKITRYHSCKGKFRHKSLGKAEAAIRALERRGLKAEDETMVAYFCGFCRHYHVGHRGPSQLERTHKC